jgi:hypothetical protein
MSADDNNNKVTVTVNKDLFTWLKIFSTLATTCVEHYADKEEPEQIAWVYRNETKETFDGIAEMYCELKAIKFGLAKCMECVPDEFK